MSAQDSSKCQIFSPAQGLNFVQGGHAAQIVKTLINNTPLSRSVNDVKTISYEQLNNSNYKTIKDKIDTDIQANQRKQLKILIFPAKSTGYCDSNIQDREIFFINDGTQTYMTTESLAAARNLRPAYLHIKAAQNEPNAQIVGNDFVIAGHADDSVVFKIPWKQEWGNQGLPEPKDVNGFNALYNKIKQQSQAINQNFQGGNSINNQNSSLNSQNITLTCVNNKNSGMNNSAMVLDNIQIPKNRTVGQLKEQILRTKNQGQNTPLQNHNVDKNDFVVCTVNAQGKPVKILDDTKTISNAFGNDTKYVVLPKVIRIKISFNGNDMVFDYPIIDDNNEFNQETFGDCIKNFLTKKRYTNIQIQSDDRWLKENGWKVASGYSDCFDICSVHITVTAAKKNPVVQANNNIGTGLTTTTNQGNTVNIIQNNQNVATEAKINVFFDFDNEPCCVTINTNATVSDLVQAVKEKVQNDDITIIYNSQKLQEGDERTLPQVQISNCTKLIVTQAKQVQNQPVNQNGVVNQKHFNFNNTGQRFSANRQIIMPNVVGQVPVPVQTITSTSNLTTSPQHLNYQTRIASIPFYPRRSYHATLRDKEKPKVGDIKRPNAMYINKNNYQYHTSFLPSRVVRMKNNIQPSVQPTDQAIFGGYNPFVLSKYSVPAQTPAQIVNNGAVPVQSVLTGPNIVQVPALQQVVQGPVTVPINQTVVPIQQTTNSITPYTQYEANGICDPQRKYRMFDGCGFLYSKKPIKTWQSQRGLQMWTDDPGAEYCFQ